MRVVCASRHEATRLVMRTACSAPSLSSSACSLSLLRDASDASNRSATSLLLASACAVLTALSSVLACSAWISPSSSCRV